MEGTRHRTDRKARLAARTGDARPITMRLTPVAAIEPVPISAVALALRCARARGTTVHSCFRQRRLPFTADGRDFSTVPGDGIYGYAREAVVRPATWFTTAP